MPTQIRVYKSITNFKSNIINNNRSERIFLLAKTDFFSRYYGSTLGLLWAFINPFSHLVVYYLVFTYLVFRNRDPNFVLYLFAGITIWSFFSATTRSGIRALIKKRYLLENIEINKVDIFISHCISNFIGFLFNVGSYCVMMLYFDVHLTWSVLLLPILFLTLFVFSLAVTIILSVLFTWFNDLDHIWDVVLLAGFWCIPIIWEQRFVFTHYKFLLYINPLTGILINFRDAMLYGQTMDYFIFFYDFVYSLILLGISLIVLKHFSQKAAEIR